MKYMCMAYGNREKMDTLAPAQVKALIEKCGPFMEDLRKTGKVVTDNGLSWDAATIRPRGGKAVVTDGPFLETKELVGGVFVLEARDLNEAIMLASKHPAAHLGEDVGWGIEVRPFENPVP